MTDFAKTRMAALRWDMLRAEADGDHKALIALYRSAQDELDGVEDEWTELRRTVDCGARTLAELYASVLENPTLGAESPGRFDCALPMHSLDAPRVAALLNSERVSLQSEIDRCERELAFSRDVVLPDDTRAHIRVLCERRDRYAAYAAYADALTSASERRKLEARRAKREEWEWARECVGGEDSSDKDARLTSLDERVSALESQVKGNDEFVDAFIRGVGPVYADGATEPEAVRAFVSRMLGSGFRGADAARLADLERRATQQDDCMATHEHALAANAVLADASAATKEAEECVSSDDCDLDAQRGVV